MTRSSRTNVPTPPPVDASGEEQEEYLRRLRRLGVIEPNEPIESPSPARDTPVARGGRASGGGGGGGRGQG
eukprot:CAMPEP_0178511130 /NCGR_PEP_ID=MMETSP0696-20121128/22206_1 /TAXON_ID=265572 /ORGANISM="Extubocellulus spinifer, Strain CCMP396" /LENGTH=70 /DNA_ID=CAMNT_0020140899 /DNA_START=55 /DNA_END=263 /DNA_ORIENTATION=+